jgi:hypothetical protein
MHIQTNGGVCASSGKLEKYLTGLAGLFLAYFKNKPVKE